MAVEASHRVEARLSWSQGSMAASQVGGWRGWRHIGEAKRAAERNGQIKIVMHARGFTEAETLTLGGFNLQGDAMIFFLGHYGSRKGLFGANGASWREGGFQWAVECGS